MFKWLIIKCVYLLHKKNLWKTRPIEYIEVDVTVYEVKNEEFQEIQMECTKSSKSRKHIATEECR